MFSCRRVTAEDLKAMAAVDLSKLPYGLQERFLQVRLTASDGSSQAVAKDIPPTETTTYEK